MRNGTWRARSVRPACQECCLTTTQQTSNTPCSFAPEVVQRLVRESRREQGLSERITDPGALARLAVLVKSR